MLLIVAIDLIVVGALVAIALTKDIEAALPSAAFVLVLLPRESQITLPGLFDISTARIVIFILAILYLVGSRETDGQAAFANTPLAGLMVVQVIWCLVSTADSIVPVASIKKLLSVVLEYYTLYYVFVKAVRSVETIHRILFGMVTAVFICSVFGSVEAYTGWKVLQWFPEVLSRTTLEIVSRPTAMDRVQATFPHSILYGAAIATAVPIALYLLTVAKKLGTKVFLWAAIGLMFLNIYKTDSRGAWLGLIFALFLLFLLGERCLRKSLMTIAALSVFVLVLRPGVWEFIRNTTLQTVDSESARGESYQYRYALRDVAQKALAQDFTRALWGYGMESFFDLHLEGELTGKRKLFWSCDSSWIEFAVETGYVGFLLTATLLLLPAIRAWKDFRILPKPERYLSLTFFVNMTAYYFMMISVSLYCWGQNGYMLWMLIALSLVCGRLKRLEHGGGKAEDSAPAAIYAQEFAQARH